MLNQQQIDRYYQTFQALIIYSQPSLPIAQTHSLNHLEYTDKPSCLGKVVLPRPSQQAPYIPMLSANS